MYRQIVFFNTDMKLHQVTKKKLVYIRLHKKLTDNEIHYNDIPDRCIWKVELKCEN